MECRTILKSSKDGVYENEYGTLLEFLVDTKIYTIT